MMTRIITLISFSTILLLGCDSNAERIKAENLLKDSIFGDWEKIIEKDSSAIEVPPPLSYIPEGMTISNDSIEFYSGFYKTDRDPTTGKRIKLFLGNVVPYKINTDSILIKNPLSNNWEFKWKFLSSANDTLLLSINDTTVIRYKKLKYQVDALPDFDQIIYSSTGCYGTCPIIDISITKDGSVLFQGEGYIKSLGFYSGNLDTKTTAYIFNKFRRANPLELQDQYNAAQSDDQSLITTYIQNGKIVKTIKDYGMESINELIWAYVPIANMHTTIKLDSLPLDEPFYPKLHYFAFKKGNLILPLKKSESFYLWTELKKSKQTDMNFTPKYRIACIGNYTYWGPDPNKARQHKYEIQSIKTDGQFFKFEFENDYTITYDLGYNFMDRNFKTTEFREAEKWKK